MAVIAMRGCPMLAVESAGSTSQKPHALLAVASPQWRPTGATATIAKQVFSIAAVGTVAA